MLGGGVGLATGLVVALSPSWQSAGPVGGHDGGQSGMVVVGVSDMGAKIEREMCRAEKIETRQPKADVEDIERAAVSVGAATA